MMPTNKQMEAVGHERADFSSRALIERWGRLHAFRTGLGLAASLVYLWALN
jgi:hypothetical protein